MMLFCLAAAPGNSFGIEFFTWASDCLGLKPHFSPSMSVWVRSKCMVEQHRTVGQMHISSNYATE